MEEYKELFSNLLAAAHDDTTSDEQIFSMLEQLDMLWAKLSSADVEEVDNWALKEVSDFNAAMQLVSPVALPLGPKQQKRFDEIVAERRALSPTSVEPTVEVEFELPNDLHKVLKAIAEFRKITLDELIVEILEDSTSSAIVVLDEND